MDPPIGQEILIHAVEYDFALQIVCKTRSGAIPIGNKNMLFIIYIYVYLMYGIVYLIYLIFPYLILYCLRTVHMQLLISSIKYFK